MSDSHPVRRLAIVLFCTLLFPTLTHALTVQLYPETALLPPPGQTIAIDIMVSDVADLGAFQFDIYYDPSVVTVSSQSALVFGEFLESTGRSVTPLQQTFDNAAGRITMAAFTVGNADGAAGNGRLAQITFTVQQQTDSPLNLSGVKLTDTAGLELFPDAVNGAQLLYAHTVHISAEGPGAVSPSGNVIVRHGDNLPMTASPEDGHHVSDILVDGASMGGSEDYTLTGVSADADVVFQFSPNQYQVDFSAGLGGSIDGESSQTVAHGSASSPVKAIPADGYDFTGWTGDHAGTENPLTLSTVTSNMAVTANFKIQTYDVSLTTGIHGALEGEINQTVQYSEGCSTVTAVPAEGYEFTGWSGDHTGTENPLTLSNVKSDMTVTANFQIKTYAVNFLSGANGSIEGETSQTINHGGSTTSITAVPADGYTFTGWTGDHAGAENPLTLSNVTSNMTVTANFQIKEYTVTFTTGNNGRLEGTTSQIIAHGASTAEIEALPDDGYHFAGWTGDYAGSENPLILPAVTSDMTIRAEFAINHYTVRFEAGDNGALDGETTQEIAYGGSTASISAKPDAGYEFVGWTGDHAGTENPLILSNISANMTIAAAFRKKEYTVTFEAGDHGELHGDLIQTVQHGDASAPMTAIPDEGYAFQGWTGDHAGTENPLTLSNVNADLSVTALFKVKDDPDVFTVAFVVDKNGSIEGEAVQEITEGENCTAVTAVPDKGFEFSGWTGDYEGTENPLTVKGVVNDMRISAAFKAREWDLSYSILLLQMLSGIDVPQMITEIPDINDDGRLGMVELLYIMSVATEN